MDLPEPAPVREPAGNAPGNGSASTDGGSGSWTEANQRYLSAALALLRGRVERRGAPAPANDAGEAAAELHAAERELSSPAALSRLAELFGLSSFERSVVLLCAGVELDARIAPACAEAHGDARRTYPTFGLALAVLPDPHWSALSPEAPLRQFGLVEIEGADGVTQAPLRLSERVLHFLTGVEHLDERLRPYLDLVEPAGLLVPSQRATAERVVGAWSAPPYPLLQLAGPDADGKRSVVTHAARALGLRTLRAAAAALPAPADPKLSRLLAREAALCSAALWYDADELEARDAELTALARWLERTLGPTFVSWRERRSLRRANLVFEVGKPTPMEQRELWEAHLGRLSPDLPGDARRTIADKLAPQFDLGEGAIVQACAEARARAEPGGDLCARLWDSCRAGIRTRMDGLAQRIEPRASWDDLVLPANLLSTLRQVGVHVRQRYTVYERWGFAARSTRSLGVSALFSGPSGTGKTTAAEVLAGELELDLYRIDLSQVVSKYIGETEKNLRRVFDAAEESGAVLLFDEADALFGKRTEVKDSHDRYANIEVSYLLQRMEEYRGLAILTTNMRNAIDSAFVRRLRFIVSFGFPTRSERESIWRRVFPAATPVDGLDFGKLAALNVTGAHIKNIALGAAFLAAEAGEPVRMTHVRRAAESEYQKIDRPLTELD